MNRTQRGGIVLRLTALLMLGVVLFAVYLVRYSLLRMAGNFCVVADPLEHADAIVVIGDDNFGGDRATRGAELFRAGWAPLVVASGRMLRPYMGIAELIGRDLENRGVPPAAIVRFDQNAENTREEAQALEGLAMQRGWHKILVVTSNYHTRRARYVFHRVFHPDIAVLVVPARDAEFDPDRWWESREGTKLLFLEGVGYCVATWELRAAPPGDAGSVPQQTQ